MYDAVGLSLPGYRTGVFGVRVILRCFAAVEHAIVADDTDTAEPGIFGKRGGAFERSGGGLVVEGEEQDDIAGGKDGIEYVPGDEAGDVGGKSQP